VARNRAPLNESILSEEPSICSEMNSPLPTSTQNEEHLSPIGMVNSDLLASMIMDSKTNLENNQSLFADKHLSVQIAESFLSHTDISFTQHERMVESPNKILPRLYLGSKKDSIDDEKLKRIGITHILSVTSGKQHVVPGCKLLAVAMCDNGKSVLDDIIERTFPFMKEAQLKGSKLLIHCQSGQNRSPTLVIAWLMKIKGYTLFKAWQLVKEEREMVMPHRLYVMQLRELDFQLQGVYSTPENFLLLCCKDGEVTIQHENMTELESFEYRESQKQLKDPSKLVVNSDRRNEHSEKNEPVNENHTDKDGTACVIFISESDHFSHAKTTSELVPPDMFDDDSPDSYMSSEGEEVTKLSEGAVSIERI